MNKDVEDSDSKLESEILENGEPTNPHTLWKQITGLVIVSIVVFYIGGIFPVLVGVFTFIDAWRAGIYKIKDKKAFANLSPVGWAIVMDGLLIVAYPVYLYQRNKLKTKPGDTEFYVLTIVSGAFVFLIQFLSLYLILNQAQAQ